MDILCQYPISGVPGHNKSYRNDTDEMKMGVVGVDKNLDAFYMNSDFI